MTDRLRDKIVPVTVIRVDPLRVVQIKTADRDGYNALQVTYGHRDAKKLNKPEAGHFAKAGVQPGKRLVELRLDSVDGFEVGQEITVDVLPAGTLVDVTGVSRGKGFAGGMKRHNFKGQGASHGNHRKHRAPGSIGASDPESASPGPGRHSFAATSAESPSIRRPWSRRKPIAPSTSSPSGSRP